jgi:DNA-binding beta-propeller fold protein YncE
MKIIPSLLLAAFAVSASAEPKVTLIDGSWNPGEGGPVTTKPNPLHRPFGVDFDSKGRMWIVELEGGRVHRLANGVRSHVAGDGSKSYKGDGGSLGQATFNGMHNLAIGADDSVYISDSWNHCIRKIDANGRITTLAGTGEPGFSGDGGPAAKAGFNYIMCITLNPKGDKLQMADLKNRRIREIDLKSGIVKTIAGNGKRGVPKDGALATEAPLIDPRAVCSDRAGNVYVLERGGHTLRVVRPDGKIYTVAGNGQKGSSDGTGSAARFNGPKHICTDPSGNVFIADDVNHLIRKYDPKTGAVTTVLGRGKIKLKQPHGVTWEKGKLYVADSSNNRILRVE